MDKGELVPDELVVDLIMDRFKEADCANGYVLRWIPTYNSTGRSTR